MDSNKRIRLQTCCSYCEKLLKNPRLLPCLHSFCCACLQNVIREGEDVICPKCSENHGTGKEKGASAMPKDILAESLIYMGRTGEDEGGESCSSCDAAVRDAVDRCLDCGEFLCNECSGIHRRLRQTRDHEIITLKEYEGLKDSEEIIHRKLYCDAHPSEELRYFCEKCKQIVCRECTIVKHKSHKYTYMEESNTIKQVVRTLESLVQKAQSKVEKVRRAVDDVNATSDLITGSIAGLKNSVRTTATEMVRFIRLAEEEILVEIDRVQSRKFHGLNQQLKNLEMNLEIFETGKCYAEHALKYLSEVEMYLVKDVISDRLKVLNKKKFNLEPVEDNNLKHVRDTKKGQKMARSSLGYLEVNGNLVINGCVRDLKNSDYQTSVEETMTTEPSQYLKSIAVDIRGPGGELLNPLRTERDYSGSYGADFQSERTGVHNVTVCLDGTEIHGSPLQVIIGEPASAGCSPSPRLSQCFGDVGMKPGGLRDVHGIVTDSEGQIVVTDTNCHRVQIFSKNGSFLRMFGSLGTKNVQFNSPHGVAVTKHGHLVIADTGNNRIQIFDNNANYQGSIDCHENNGELFRPYGIAVDHQGNVIALDREKGKIRIYKNKNQILQEFGGVGSDDCQFINPSYITVNKTGHIIVSDMGNDRIQVLKSTGQLLSKFGKTGVGNGEFRWPTGIAIKTNGDIVVADSCNNRIQTFRADGSFEACRGPLNCSEDERLKLPEGLTVDENNRIIVADWGNNRVQIL